MVIYLIAYVLMAVLTMGLVAFHVERHMLLSPFRCLVGALIIIGLLWPATLAFMSIGGIVRLIRMIDENNDRHGN